MEIKKAYIEITNCCNLRCNFCVGTKRAKEYMTVENFDYVLQQVKRYTRYIYLHLMGEPLLHSQLDKILDICDDNDVFVNIVTNGTLLGSCGKLLQGRKSIRKVAISLQSVGANSCVEAAQYLKDVFEFIDSATCIVELRLWANNDVGDYAKRINAIIVKAVEDKYNVVISNDKKDVKLRDKLFFTFADRFYWPIEDKADSQVKYCYGLRDQFGVLVDGDVVACCLDSDGINSLGNIYKAALDDILRGERAVKIVEGFSKGKAVEKLCKGCQYATRFSKADQRE